jgi:predicted kinase
MDQPCKLYVLIGVPGSGKSTWVANQTWANDCCIISTDFWVEEEAKRVGKTYSEIFKDYMPRAVELMAANVVSAREMKHDIIWDQTSTTVSSRTRKFRMLPDYYAIAVVFRTPEQTELARRLSSRPGKVIPIDVVNNMCKNWEEPTLEEGFDEIWHAQ